MPSSVVRCGMCVSPRQSCPLYCRDDSTRGSHALSNHRRAGPPMNPGALDGIKVLDLTSHLSGPYCTMILGDLGADVVKIERAGAGDDARRQPPHVNGESVSFMITNRNKRSVALDLKNPEHVKICV